MQICIACATKMKCVKNGVRVRWDGHWCYAGDHYRCETCGNSVISIMDSTQGFDDDGQLGQYFEMPVETGENR